MDASSGFWIAVVGVVGGIIGALITGLFQRKKVNSGIDNDTAQTNEQIRKTVMLLLTPLTNRVDELEKELRDWKNWAHALVNQLKCLGHEPVPFKPTKRE